MRDDRERSQFEMTSRDAVDEAAEWLRELGYQVSVNQQAALRPGRQQMVVFHAMADGREVRRIIALVDPRAIERRVSSPRRGP
jgi:hypothetical protein